MRLTNEHRTAIRREIIRDRFEKRQKEIDEKRQSIADRIYERELTEAQREALVDLPESFFAQRTSISLQLGAEYTTLTMSEQRPIPYDRHRNTFAVLGARDPLTKEYQETTRDSSRLRVDEREMTASVNSVLASVTTDNRLIDEWPEIKKIVRRIVQPKAKLLPAVRMEKLNKELGLGQDKACAAT